MMDDSLMYFVRMGLTPEGGFRATFYHPTFFYEMLWNLIGFALIHFLYKKKKFDGQVFLMYLCWYGFGRMMIEELRIDALTVGVFKISQISGFLCFTIGLCLLIYRLVKARRVALTAEEYVPTYGKFHYGEASDAVKEKWKAEMAEMTDTDEEQEDRQIRDRQMSQELNRLFEDDGADKKD